MKKIMLTLIIAAALGTGCEQLMDIELGGHDHAPVIEANLSYPDGMLQVTISRTGNYFDTGHAAFVDNAVVYLEKQSAGMEAVHKGQGRYQLDGILVQPGDRFHLVVELDGIVYRAETTVVPPVEIDGVSYSFLEGDSFFRPGYRFNVTVADPPGGKNYYRIRVYKGGYLFNRPNDLVVFDDTDMDGQLITVRLLSQFYIEEGESLTFELLSIDREAWRYFTSYADLLNAGPDSPAPANPVSHFTEGALGYFYAWSSSRMVVIVSDSANSR